jgi:serine protease Do
MLTDFSNQLADAVAASAPSVVQVHGRRRPASGLVYANGIVVTTMRAVGREDGLRVRTHGGDTLEATLAGWDPATSLAVLQVPGLAAPPFAPSATPVRVGDLALAVARSWSNAVTASAGIVAVIGGPLATGRRRAIDQVIRTTAPMHDGFSGGAFLGANGALIGMTTAATIRGFGVVIPAAIVWKTAAHILEHGGSARGYLGIVGQPVRLPDAQGGSGTGALLVASVAPDGPAAAAGVLIGDVILSLDGTPVASPEELLDLLTASRVDQVATLHLLRGGVATDVKVTIGRRA